MDEIDPKILFLIVVSDGKPEEATPLQEFSPSLCMNSWMIRDLSFLPTTVVDLTPQGHGTFLARKMSGTHPVHWHGHSPLRSAHSRRSSGVLCHRRTHSSLCEVIEWCRFTGKGELTRAISSELREAKGPLTSRQIAQSIVELRGDNTADRGFVTALRRQCPRRYGIRRSAAMSAPRRMRMANWFGRRVMLSRG